jgi:poly(3-hydroxybutyrate) depolymerase
VDQLPVVFLENALFRARCDQSVDALLRGRRRVVRFVALTLLRQGLQEAEQARQRPVPVLAFAGDKDTTNPIEGGGSPYWQYPMSAALARWAQLDGCQARPRAVIVSPKRRERRYAGCRGGAEVTGDILAGAGHVWTADNEAMWAFFARHRR